MIFIGMLSKVLRTSLGYSELLLKAVNLMIEYLAAFFNQPTGLVGIWTLELAFKRKNLIELAWVQVSPVHSIPICQFEDIERTAITICLSVV